MIDRTVQRAPDNVEQALPLGKFRDTALEFLVIHRLQTKDVNRALELFMLIESDTAMTVPARELLMRPPRDRQSDRDRVFGELLRAYREASHRQVGSGTHEYSALWWSLLA